MGPAKPGSTAMDCRVVLIGMMGSGKTTVGRLLAERLGWPYLDNDGLLETATGRTARGLAAEGTAALLTAEMDALRTALAAPPPAVIAAAAGTVLDPGLPALLRDATVVWLRAKPPTLVARAAGSDRPHLERDPSRWLHAADATRADAYATVADVVLWSDEPSPDAIAREIHRELVERGCAQPVTD